MWRMSEPAAKEKQLEITWYFKRLYCKHSWKKSMRQVGFSAAEPDVSFFATIVAQRCCNPPNGLISAVKRKLLAVALQNLQHFKDPITADSNGRSTNYLKS
jgi:hypothetical protein